MEIPEETSLKSLIQGMIPDSMGVLQGTVIQASPLKIQVINDDKLVLTENIICLPAHLQEYQTTCDIMLGSGTIDSQTYNDGQHSQPDAGYGGAHVNNLQTFNIWNAVIKVHHALQLGETVYILSFNQGKKYYILDRKEKKT